MINTRILSLSIITLLSFACNPPATNSSNDSEILFGENSDSWINQGDANWTFENDELTGSLQEGAGFLITKNTYQDFLLELEFNPDSTINSGVFIRCNTDTLNPIDCYEINIWDLHPNQDFRTGAIVTRLKPIAKVETIGKWNNYKIKCQDNQIQVWVNDILTAELEDDTLEKGTIGLQAAGNGQVKFRNVRLESLE